MKNEIKPMRQLYLYIKNNRTILLAFILPALILETTYIANGVFPFGNRSILIIDLYHQYAPFISDLQDKLRSFSGLGYNWSGSLGTGYLPLYAYYLASPLNLITLLFPKEYLAEALLVLTLLKTGLSGVCFAIYLGGVHNERSLVAVSFSMLYALSGYVLAFSWNIMWMDAIYLLPLIMLGIVKLVRDGEGLFYCITLTVAILSNFYMAFFICIFIVLYYPICLFKYHNMGNRPLLIKSTTAFAGFSLLSGGLSALLLLPTFFQLGLTSAAGDIFPKVPKNYFDLFDYITRNFTAIPPSIREGGPNLYCGIIVLILLPVYFLSRRISLKEKLLNMALLMFLILSFNINILDFIWHGFHYPNQIPYRFSFVYVFLVLSMGYEAFRNLHEFSGKQVGIICFMVLSMVLMSQKFDDLSIQFVTVYISTAFVILYAVSLSIEVSSNAPPSSKKLILFLVLTAEMLANTISTSINIAFSEGYTIRDGYASGSEVSQIRAQISSIAENDKGFYRMEVIPTLTCNDPALYNYRGISFFSSTAPEKPVRLFKNLGFSSNGINSIRYEGSTAILDSLLGVKYLIYRDMTIEEKLYKQIASTDELTVFQNPYALTLGFQAPYELKDFSSSGSDPFKTQNLLMEGISGVDNILLPIAQEEGTHYNLSINSRGTEYYSFNRIDRDKDSTARIRFHVDEDSQVYLYYKAPYNMKGSGFVRVNGKKVEFNPRHSTIINLGFCKGGTSPEMEVTFDKSCDETGSFEVYGCRLNIPAFEQAISSIRENSMDVESFTDTGITGRVESKTDGLMVMSIPYDKGWQVKVDNQEVETMALDDCLLSFELSKGQHKIEMKYYPVMLPEGIFVTLASILILVFLFIKRSSIMGSAFSHLKKGDE